MLNTLKESLKRLFKNGKVAAEQIEAMKVLTDEEKKEILAVKAE